MMRFVPMVSRGVGLPLFLLLLVLLLAACGGRAREAPQESPTAAATEMATEPTPATPTAPPTAAAEESEEAAAPAAESPLAAPNTSPLAQPNQSPLAQPPASPLATPRVVPQVETAPGTGAVTGVLLVHTEQGEKPVSGMIIAVADALTNTELTGDADTVTAYRYQEQASPQTNTDENGFFAIGDIPPGRYGLVLDLVMSSFILRQPGSDEDMIITVEPDQQIDMGRLVYDELPDPAMPD